VKLCLDEHYSREIAAQLRHAGHDVDSLQGRPELIQLPDADLLSVMTSDRRALLTENVADFDPLLKQLAARGERHYGVIYSSPRSMPRSRNTIGVFVEGLDEILRSHAGDDDFVNRVQWL
jgi:hypothetical protein